MIKKIKLIFKQHKKYFYGFILLLIFIIGFTYVLNIEPIPKRMKYIKIENCGEEVVTVTYVSEKFQTIKIFAAADSVIKDEFGNAYKIPSKGYTGECSSVEKYKLIINEYED